MKFECQVCHEITSVSDNEIPVRHVEKIVKEPCRCGMTVEYRSWRVGGICAVVALCMIFVTLFGCEYIELQKIKAIDPTKFEVKESPTEFRRLIVTPKTDEKKPEEKK